MTQTLPKQTTRPIWGILTACQSTMSLLKVSGTSKYVIVYACMYVYSVHATCRMCMHMGDAWAQTKELTGTTCGGFLWVIYGG